MPVLREFRFPLEPERDPTATFEHSIIYPNTRDKRFWPIGLPILIYADPELNVDFDPETGLYTITDTDGIDSVHDDTVVQVFETDDYVEAYRAAVDKYQPQGMHGSALFQEMMLRILYGRDDLRLMGMHTGVDPYTQSPFRLHGIKR